MRMCTTALLVAGSIGLAFAGSSAALAQSCGTYGGYDPQTPAITRVIVTAPPMRIERGRLNAPLEQVSLSRPVSYADLNLCTASGAEEFRARIRIAANNVCKELKGMYRYAMPGSPSCYRGALDNGMFAADNVIGDVRGER